MIKNMWSAHKDIVKRMHIHMQKGSDVENEATPHCTPEMVRITPAREHWHYYYYYYYC